MTKRSAGILMFEGAGAALRLLLVASRRPVLGEEGRGRLVDPQGRI